MFPAVTVPKSSEREPSTTKSNSSPACRCSGSLAPASMRLSTACRFVAGSAQRLLGRTPGCRSCHGKSLIEMIWDSGVVVALICRASAERIGWRESRLLRLELQVLASTQNYGDRAKGPVAASSIMFGFGDHQVRGRGRDQLTLG